MVIIEKQSCIGCGRCQFVRFSLNSIKDDGVWECYEDPRPEDMKFVENAMAECPANAILVKEQ